MHVAEQQVLSHLFTEDFFHLVMDHNPNWVFVKNEKSEFLYANKAFLQHLPPHKRDKLVGSTLIEDFNSASQAAIYLEEDRKAFQLGNTELIEEITDYLGKTTTILTRKTCFRAANGEKLMLGICTDITEHATRQRELVQTNTMLQNFAAVAAHDLRSPLCTYSSLLDLIKNDKESFLSDKAREYIDMMHDSAVRLTHHITGLLGTYRASHFNQLNRTEVDLNVVLEQVRFNLDTLIRDTGASVLSNKLPILNVDESLFRHMLHNLIENALKYYSPERPPIVIIKHAVMNDGMHQFTVEDNGIGIKPSQESNVFQLYGTEASDGTGIGLGLSLCRRISQLHGGRMWVDHSYTRGCRICFTIHV